MSNKRLVAIVALVGVLAAGAILVRLASTTSTFMSGVAVVSISQPAGDIRLAGAEASDYFQRHPETMHPVTAPDLSDYSQRHPNATGALTVGASDWFERHPGALNTSNAVDRSDYFQRHPELMASGNAVDLSDWFQRHPESVTR